MKMMFTNSIEKDFQAKQEGGSGDLERFSKASSSSRQWPGFKNPRIVRVSHSFGGKDRHSKVCTVRGLRDRRIRLSVPTAVQLYDLQDKLGLGQPSKVVDWLLDATKHEIDKLPPLQMPMGTFSEFHQRPVVSHEPNAPQTSVSPFFDVSHAYIKDGGTQSLPSTKEGSKMIHYNVEDDVKMARKRAWDSDATLRAKCKEVEGETPMERTSWMKGDGAGANIAQVPVQNFFPVSYNSSFPSTLNNPMTYNSIINHWEPSNLSLSQFGGNVFLPQADLHATHSMAPTSLLALQSEPQLFIRPSAATPSVFPPYAPYITTPSENDPRQINQFQFLSSSSQHFVPNSLMPSLHTIGSAPKFSPLNVNPKVSLNSLNNDESQAK